ncbi:hypothetical protein FGM00_09490 [Aggregatimonas sangjinii]|uniref:Uncharacterized protein n=1 Tax=Aggregatimonas sangjinii TaxID=2583587 RepID=A0A5B7SQ64_9FLAO|nr:hypothetical protein [Aggregatimonas sangjinii]QCX00332.1 hypothetical protein FGM00_09490 [Aggregatimonas sangjinii]
MESHNIEKLIEKYFEATATVAEEETLRQYFASESVATHLAQYAPMFQYFSHAKEERFTKPVPIKTGIRKQLFRWVSVAAVAVLLVGVYFNRTTERSLEETYTQEEIAAAQEAFSLLAINFNKGTDQLSRLEEFDKNTNKFLIK